MLSRSQLAAAMPGLARKPALLDAYLPHLVAAMDEAEINTPKRIAAFLAQVGHESADFRYMEEVWGPTKAQRGYTARKDLGNTRIEAINAAKARGTTPGPFYKGHGPIQVTGFSNHEAAGKALGVDAVNHPELLATPEHGFRAAAWYWTTRGLNRYADRDQFETLTRRINGGLNGIEDRLERWARAKRALTHDDSTPHALAATPQAIASGGEPAAVAIPDTTAAGPTPTVSLANAVAPTELPPPAPPVSATEPETPKQSIWERLNSSTTFLQSSGIQITSIGAGIAAFFAWPGAPWLLLAGVVLAAVVYHSYQWAEKGRKRAEAEAQAKIRVAELEAQARVAEASKHEPSSDQVAALRAQWEAERIVARNQRE